MSTQEQPRNPSRVVWLGLALALAALGLSYATQPFKWEADQQLIQGSGLVALGFFICAFLCTPIRRFGLQSGYRVPNLAPWRRTFGLTATAAAGLHLTLVYSLHFQNAPWFSPWLKPYTQAGAAAFLAMTLLAITSFPRITRSLKIRYWKTLHRVVHIIFILLFIHLLLAPHVELFFTLGLFSSLACISWVGRLNP